MKRLRIKILKFLIEKILRFLIEKLAKDYHLSKNPPRGRKKAEARAEIKEG